MSAQEMASTAKALVAPGKGILAADESFRTIEKRFKQIGLESTETHRRDYRQLLFSAPGSEEYISGVILFDETIRQKAEDGTPFVDLLKKQGVVPGIKVDNGAKPLAGAKDEKVTEGLDGLRERLEEYYKLGARFTKWRAVITIGDDIPSDYCLEANAHALGRYAALCQEQGLVPIVEPEVLMDGSHSIDRCYDVTKRTLHKVFNELYTQRVALDQMLLKPNMVISGKEASKQAKPEEVAQKTVQCFRETVPSAVPGIVFLSGGQSDELATEHLSLMNKLYPELPWELSFSYGRALQAPALETWAGKKDNVESAKKAYVKRARLNSAARFGKYERSMEKDPA